MEQDIANSEMNAQLWMQFYVSGNRPIYDVSEECKEGCSHKNFVADCEKYIWKEWMWYN